MTTEIDMPVLNGDAHHLLSAGMCCSRFCYFCLIFMQLNSAFLSKCMSVYQCLLWWSRLSMEGSTARPTKVLTTAVSLERRKVLRRCWNVSTDDATVALQNWKSSTAGWLVRQVR